MPRVQFENTSPRLTIIKIARILNQEKVQKLHLYVFILCAFYL
uniref:Uncharacterized protein n=1 Tax=Leclercia adecarboxylata TaxID=83655 RepID=A0A482M075_9ENTR|nr:Hypothetical protein [Leclercia adecarboxylata]